MISIVLPTVRPNLIEDCLANIHAACDDVPHEIVVVADFPAKNWHAPWIVRSRQGVVDAICVGYKYTTGDVIFLTNDETTYGQSCIKLLYEAVQRRPETLWTPKHFPLFDFRYYGRVFAAFPCASRALIERLGGFFDPMYRAFYADPDLSMRAHAAGVPVTECSEACIHHYNRGDREGHSQSVAKYFKQDQASFRARWDYLGDWESGLGRGCG